MRKLQFILILLITSLTFSAQFEIVKDITELPDSQLTDDILKKDVNGDWCAVLRIATEIKGIGFSGFGYEMHEYRDGCYFVYMQPESKNLTLIKEGFTTRPYLFPFKLRSKKMYEMEISGTGEMSVINEIMISIKGEPNGAEILLDGLSIGSVPQLIVSVGKHELKVRKDGYSEYVKSINVSPDSTLFSYNLIRITEVPLEIITEPAGAVIVLDGKELGISPVTDFVKMGNHRINLSKEGCGSITKEIEVVYPQTSLSFELKDCFKEETVNNDRVPVKVKPVEQIRSAGIETLLVKGGTYTMGAYDGDADEKPPHKVSVSDFYIGKYEITQKEWQDITGHNPSYNKNDRNPVEKISWYDAVEFCNKISEMEGLKKCYSDIDGKIIFDRTANGYRLPTEAEWEYAAKAGGKNAGWVQFNSGNKTHPVGEFEPNSSGVYDMIGNAAEWCWDIYGENYYKKSAGKDPSGPDTGDDRVIRGGFYYSHETDCRPSNRDSWPPGLASQPYIGFRIARNAK